MGRLVTSKPEAQEKTLKEVIEKLNMFEAGAKEFFPEGASFTNGENLGLLDILVSATFGPYKAHEEVLGAEVLTPEKTPLLFSWITALNNHPLVKELIPPHDKLVGLLKSIKQHGPLSHE